MYKNTKANIAMIAVSLVLMGLGTFLDRSQSTVGDVSFMRAMIPHHSLAITRSERFDVDDYRVCELAVEISEAQRREIDEMDWLIEDIRENGLASHAQKPTHVQCHHSRATPRVSAMRADPMSEHRADRQEWW